MIFGSPAFLFVFLPFILFFYYISPEKYKNFILLIGSILFYIWGEGKIIAIILLWVLINYFFSLRIDKDKKRSKLWFISIVIVNLAILFYFKYMNFFISNLQFVTGQSFNFRQIYLPLAVSFFTFHAISYNFDIFRRINRAEKKLSRLALYLLFFPHLIAGPILRYHKIYKQFIKRKVTVDNFSYGIQRFIIGLSKKVLIADTLATVADEIFAINPVHLTPEQAWLGIISFTIQIYFDFSGYSDMAIGLAKMFGFNFPENFNYPYISKSVGEFWRRWHMTLSSWMKDYLYIPLGGNRVSKLRAYSNLLAVFLIVGIWHGAGWTFIFWGVLHGSSLALERVKNGLFLKLLFPPLRYFYTMTIVTVGWVFFRSESLTYAFSFLKTMFNRSEESLIYHSFSYFLNNDIILALMLGLIFSVPLLVFLKKALYFINIKKLSIPLFDSLLPGARVISLIILFIFDIIFVAAQTYNSFIYFRF